MTEGSEPVFVLDLTLSEMQGTFAALDKEWACTTPGTPEHDNAVAVAEKIKRQLRGFAAYRREVAGR